MIDIRPGDVFCSSEGVMAAERRGSEWHWDYERTYRGFVVGTELEDEDIDKNILVIFLSQGGKLKVLPLGLYSHRVAVFRNGERIW